MDAIVDWYYGLTANETEIASFREGDFSEDEIKLIVWNAIINGAERVTEYMVSVHFDEEGYYTVPSEHREWKKEDVEKEMFEYGTKKWIKAEYADTFKDKIMHIEKYRTMFECVTSVLPAIDEQEEN